MSPLLLDTNTLSYILKNVPPVPAKLDEAVRQEKSFLLASVAHYELTRYLHVDGILVFLQDVLMPRKLEVHFEDGFQAVREAVRRRVVEKAAPPS